MSGTKAGGLKAAKTNMKKYGKDFYKLNGAKGGRNGHTGGFAANPALARIAGAKGGRKSKRGSQYDIDIKNAVIRDYKKGNSVYTVAKKYGVSETTIYKWTSMQ